MSWRTFAFVFVVSIPALGSAHPQGDLVPKELQGEWAASKADCLDEYASTSMEISEDSIALYEDKGFLVIGARTERARRAGHPMEVGFVGRFNFIEYKGFHQADVELQAEGPDLIVSFLKQPADPDLDPIAIETLRRVRCVGPSAPPR